MTEAHHRTHEAVVAVDTQRPLGAVQDDVYGHFLESAFFGNIEGGVFDEGSSLSIDEPGHLNGARRDVLELVKDLAPGAIRWPGGNFTSPYHWQDGIGPRDRRPTRLELAWGELETNHFGTDEFLAWCEAVGAEPYLVHSALNVDEAVRWVEYTNLDRETTLVRTRRENGREKPWNVRYWGVGNEVYGPWQMGHRNAAQYAADARAHAQFMRRVDPSIKLIGVGLERRPEWTEALLDRAGTLFDYLSVHLYGATNGLWDGDDYDDVVAQSVYIEQELNAYSRLVSEASSRAGLDAPPALSFDEWTMRHLEPASWPQPQAGDDGGVAPRELPELTERPREFRVNRWDSRSVSDAVFCAGVFHAVHRLAGHDTPVGMANPVNLVNANGLVVARPGGAFRSTIYHIWHLYRHHTGRTVLPCVVESPSRSTSVIQGDTRNHDGSLVTAPMTMPYLDVCATRTEDGSLRLAIINRHKDDIIRLRPVLDGAGEAIPQRAHMLTLGGDVDGPRAVNTLSDPDRVGVRDLGEVEAMDGGWDIPPHSVNILNLGDTQ